MKKSELQKVIKEALRGYSPQIGKTQGGTSDEFMQILTKIAKGEDKNSPEEDNTSEEDAIYEAQEPKNTWAKHPYIKDLLNALIYPDDTVSLQIYGTKGRLPIKQTAVVPFSQFTPDYVEKQVSTHYDIDDKFREGIKQFVDSVQNRNA